jgi:hypothetical protein
MKASSSGLTPVARTNKLITKEVDGELLVYDQESHNAHCLNKLAADIWKLCDGRTTASEMATRLSTEAHETVGATATTEQIVLIGLEELRRIRLLEPLAFSGNISSRGMSRRQAMRAFGFGVAVALPMVATIAAPTPAQAGSCKHNNASCITGSECCSGVCASSKCLGG